MLGSFIGHSIPLAVGLEFSKPIKSCLTSLGTECLEGPGTGAKFYRSSLFVLSHWNVDEHPSVFRRAQVKMVPRAEDSAWDRGMEGGGRQRQSARGFREGGREPILKPAMVRREGSGEQGGEQLFQTMKQPKPQMPLKETGSRPLSVQPSLKRESTLPGRREC